MKTIFESSPFQLGSAGSDSVCRRGDGGSRAGSSYWEGWSVVGSVLSVCTGEGDIYMGEPFGESLSHHRLSLETGEQGGETAGDLSASEVMSVSGPGAQ